MTSVQSAARPSSFNPLFLAPPALPAPDDESDSGDVQIAPDRASFSTGRGSALQMLRGAREAATGMGISDELLQSVIDDPAEVAPDASNPQRTRLRGQGIEITLGHDGMVLRVARRR
jgi:hypothetical protein